MLRDKSTTIISELQTLCSSQEQTLETLFKELRSLKISTGYFSHIDKNNTKHTCFFRFILLFLFPLLNVKDVSHYKESFLYQTFKCGKDVFYRFLNNPLFDWRKFAYRINLRLIKRVAAGSYNENGESVRCLIADDTDLLKCGKKFELTSRIYSHVTHTFNHGFKCLALAYHDGKSLFGIDFSLHGEKGSDPEKPYGLTKKQSKSRFTAKRDPETPCNRRITEYAMKKTEMLLVMIRTAIAYGIRFDYLLTDSWFTCFELVKFIVTRKIGCHFLGAVKNGPTKYLYKGKSLKLKGILGILKHTLKAGEIQKSKKSKKLGCRFYEVEVELKGLKIKLFFCKMSKNGNWNALMTTNTKLHFEKAYEIYSTRWCIEVFFKECKQCLRLGKCESRNFNAQIAATTLCFLQYNLLAAVKRFQSYESFGALFRQAKSETLELTVKERIWLIVIKILTILTKYFDVDTDMLMNQILLENEELINILNFKYIGNSA